MAIRRYRGRKPLGVTADMVFAAVKGVIDAGLEKEFLAECARRDAKVTVEPTDINFVKEFLDAHQAQTLSPMALRVTDSDKCTPA